jgi:hypothetical protein
MNELLTVLHDSALATWVRESSSLWAYPMIITMHTFGLAVLVGASAAVDLRVLGVARQIPLTSLRGFFPVMWAGFWLNAASGVLLLIAYPTKALTNPVFYLKLVLIGVATAILLVVRRRLLSQRAPASGPGRVKLLAVASLVCWAGAITAGRLLAYTYSRLTVTRFD